jgi:phage FluMu protein Com
MDQTHYVDSERIPDRRGNVRAVCGKLVNERSGETALEPTCPTCAAWVKARDEEPIPAWASAKWGAR